MSLTLILKNAAGALFVNQNHKRESDPVLEGFAKFPLSDDENGPALRLDVAAWQKKKGDKPYYSISVGGLNGALFKEENKRSDTSPDYTGSIGPDRELRIVAWMRQAEGTNDTYLSIVVSEPNNTSQQAPTRSSSGKSGAPAFI